MTPQEWVVGGGTGDSSLTIWSVMMNVTPGRADIPYDPDDFGRCYRLLAAIPEWRGRLTEVAERYAVWRPLVREWATLERMYSEAVASGTGRADDMYAFMKSLRDENDAAA